MKVRDLRAIIDLIDKNPVNDDMAVLVMYDGGETLEIERVIVDRSVTPAIVILDTN